VLGPGNAGVQIQPEGIKGAELNNKQRAMLLEVISQWAGIVNDLYERPRMDPKPQEPKQARDKSQHVDVSEPRGYPSGGIPDDV
jgi:hypothetical protein